MIAGPALARAAVELTEFPMARQLFFASDNAAFARAGVVAHSISAGTLHDDYHQPGDEFEKIDTAHMTKVIQGLAEVVTEFANRDAASQQEAADALAFSATWLRPPRRRCQVSLCAATMGSQPMTRSAEAEPTRVVRMSSCRLPIST